MASSDRMEEFAKAILTQDTHKRLKLAIEMSSYLKNSSTSLNDYEVLVDGLVMWASSSNFKVSSQGLDLLTIIAARIGPPFKGQISSMLGTVVDRLGDSKQIVREHAQELLFTFMEPVSSPQYVFDMLVPYFNHKNWRVREVLMVVLTHTINKFSASSLQINKLTPHLVKLLGDATGQVRDTAFATLVEIYRHVGDRVRTDLSKRNIQEAKLNSLFAKFDQVQRSGDMVAPTHVDRVDGNVNTVERKKLKGTSVRRSTSFTAGDKKKHHVPALDRGNSAASGAVDESDFMTAWEDVPDPKMLSMREFPQELDKINAILSDGNLDWEKRVDALRGLRSLAKISPQVDNYAKMMKDLENALRISVKDLRSSVVREACITLSYMSSIMENKFDYLAECMLPPLINLIPNSAKVMSTSGHAALRLIIKHTPSPRLIPIIVSNLLTSKSKDIRRRCAEYMGLLLECWTTHTLKNHVALLEEAIRKGIADADSEARAAVRRAYWHFADHYKSRADSMMESFDASKQKLLQSDKNLLNAGISTQAPKYGSVSGVVRPNSTMTKSDNSLNKKMSATRTNGVMGPPSAPPMQRSASQLDYKSARAAKMSPRQRSCDDMKRHTIQRSTMREGRVRAASAKSASSQPSSRTGSPKRIMPTFNRERSEDYMKTYSPQKTRIPTPAKPASRSTSRSASRSGSRQTSRDPSPARTNQYESSSHRIRNGSTSSDRGLSEDAIWDALQRSKGRGRERRNSHNSVTGQGSDESDTSSVSSHNQNRQVAQDFDEILMMLQKPESTGKRDGLNSMLAFLHSLKSMTHDEVLHVKTIFNRYFAEQNSKVYSLFLDVLSEFIVQYKNDLQDWLFILLTRLLQRISVDALPSSQTKIARTLDVVRDSYPYDYQFQIITKYITDNTQTPTLKMKVSLLQYLLGLVALMDASDFANTGPIRLAVSKIITWISEPKSADVRKEATAVIVALFQLNTPEFSALLSNVPSSIQDGATRVIQLNIKQNVYGMPSPHPSDEVKSHQTYQTKRDERPTYSTPHQAKKRNEDGALHYRPASRQDSHDDMSPTSKIPIRQRPSLGGDEVFTSPVASSSSTSTSTPIRSKTPSYSNDHSGNWLTKDTSDYLPKKYEDLKINGTCSPSEFMKDSSAAVSEEDGQPSSVQLVNQVYVVLTSPDAVEESDDTKSALLELLKMIRSGDKQLNATKLTSFIPPLLNLLRHREATIRCLVARSLREMALMRADVFQSDLATFIVPLLQAEADPQKEVARTAEECCTILSQSLSPSVVISVVSPLVGSAEYPTNQSAIKMMHVIAENCEASLLRNYLDIIVPNLLKAYDHQESSVRKAAVFCLVSIHNRAGSDKVMPYFKTLAGSKMKLLNLYIRRSQSTTV